MTEVGHAAVRFVIASTLFFHLCTLTKKSFGFWAKLVLSARQLQQILFSVTFYSSVNCLYRLSDNGDQNQIFRQIWRHSKIKVVPLSGLWREPKLRQFYCFTKKTVAFLN